MTARMVEVTMMMANLAKAAMMRVREGRMRASEAVDKAENSRSVVDQQAIQ